MRNVIILFLVGMLAGCATVTMPGSIQLNTEPVAKYEKDPDTNFNKYKNFSVFPQAEFDKDAKTNPIEEKQLLFIIRNQLEAIGYNYVSDAKDADFMVGIKYSNEYKTQYIPPSSYSIPWHVPGQTQTTFINNYNTFSGHIGSDYFSGSGSGFGTATTTSPGYYVPMTLTSPGGYVGWYYPCFLVSVLDVNSKKLVWSGSAVGSTPNADIRLSAQTLLLCLFNVKHYFPENVDRYKRYENRSGLFGIKFNVSTPDGNNFYPTVDAVYVGSPAYKEGGLQPGDLITQVDKKSTLNWSLNQFADIFFRNKGDSVDLAIQRNNKLVDVNMIAEDKVAAQKEWQEKLIIENGQTVKVRASQ